MSKKWLHGAIPALLIHGCIGTVYCWSLLYDYIKESITGNCTWAFSLAIFFLGISAAFFGHLVEKNVKKAATISSILFGSGMILSGVACYINSIPLLYLSYGAIMGTGVGIGYITPVKTLMMWFKNNKGLATGLAIMGFGLAKVIATPLLNWSIERCGIYCTFFSFGVWYTLIMLLAAILLKKPIEEGKIENTSRPKFKSLKEWFDRKKQLLNLPAITTIWLIFYLNISSGLAIISYEKYYYETAGIGIVLGLVFSAIFNSLGRFGVAWWSDYFKNRGKLFGIILTFSVLSGITAFMAPGFIPVAVLLCNAGYGAMFSIMPSVLADRYGMKDVSEIHGLILSAWAFAGLSGNQFANLLVGIPESSYKTLILGSVGLYCIALSLSAKLWNKD